LDRIADLVPLYRRLLSLLAGAGAEWVQIDEPMLVTDLDEADLELVTSVYRELVGAADRPALLVATYFGKPGPALAALAATPVEAIGVDFASGATVEEIASLPALASKLLVAGLVDSYNVWRTDPDRALGVLATLLGSAAAVAVSSSCSLLHVPYSLEQEPEVEPRLRSWLAFGAEKVAEIRMLATALPQGTDAVATERAGARAAIADRRKDLRLHNSSIRARLESLGPDGARRAPAEQRRRFQQQRLNLPPLPTTTIGSFPQTGQIRVARAELRAGTIDAAEYERRMRAEIAAVVALQEEIGLDVLVHGEPERNDMVQYFAEQLDGFFATANGWVQSYGTRCVRPPILYGDVARPRPMTVAWSTYAQSLTDKPVKGMLT